jgi:polysaccharide biosynthesis protein PslG
MVNGIGIIRLSATVFFAFLIGSGGRAYAALQANGTERFEVGVGTHFSQNKGVVEMNLRSILHVGIGSIRDQVGWSSVEHEKGKLVMPERNNRYVRQASGAGLDVLLILSYANRFYDNGDRPRSAEAIEGFCRYAEFVVKHFGKDVHLYEIWNEWDIGIGLPAPYRVGGSPEDYVKLLKAVYPRIKAAEPDVTVMAGAATSGGVRKGWLEKIVQLGALDYCDAISIHGYNYSSKFPERSPEACSAWISGVQEMLRKYNDGRDVPFYVTEMGWPTHVGKRGTPAELSGSYLARLYLLARTSPSFRGIWWYDFQDDGWRADYNENNFGIVRPDLTPKPAYYVLADISDLIANGRYMGRVKTDDDNIEIIRFKCKGRDVWALWSADDQEHQVILQTKGLRGDLTIHQLGHEPYQTGWGFRDWPSRKSEIFPDRLSVVAGARPMLISGDMANVSVVQIIPRIRKPSNGEK